MISIRLTLIYFLWFLGAAASQHLAVRQKEIGSEPKEVSGLTRAGSSSSARFFLLLWSADRSERRCFTLQRLQDELNPPRSSISRRNENENTTKHRIEKLPGREIFDSSERFRLYIYWKFRTSQRRSFGSFQLWKFSRCRLRWLGVVSRA